MSASLLPLVPALPLLGAIIIAVLNRRASRVVAGSIASLMVGLAALLSFGTILEVATTGNLATTVYTWMKVGAFVADFGLVADPLSATMMCLVTGVGFLIHVYAVGYMDDPADAQSTWRFFAYLNLFVFSMLLLVMGDNFLVMFVGWEGVGLCSYLLIGFWFQNSDFASAGKKAFITNRVGDFAFVLGLFWLFWSLGDSATLNFAQLESVVVADPWLVGGVGGAAVTGICLLFFGGATGKSAQIPLFVWLPDAMAGPTPVSALIHAATMVTSGIYMICRLNFLFSMSPVAMGTIATIGALTALLAATIAVTQTDIKKVLAYSTVSQLGYMFLGVGIGAYTAGFFHVLTHAFFKALLFLGAGAIIHALHHEQDMRRMGGLRSKMKGTFLVFFIAWLAIIGFPGFSGFFSKDEILWLTFMTPPEQIAVLGDSFPLPTMLWGIGLVTAMLTAFYMSRLMFMTFWGEYRGGHDAGHGHGAAADHGHGHDHHSEPHDVGPVMMIPLYILAFLALFGGLLNLPHWFPVHSISGKLHHFLEPVFANANVHFGQGTIAQEMGLMGGTLVLIGLSVGAAYYLYVLHPGRAASIAAQAPELYKGSLNKWYVDEVYGFLFIKPILLFSRLVLWPVVDAGIVDGLVNAVGKSVRSFGAAYSRHVQTGQVQLYALGIALGAAVVVIAYAVGA
jgi:NADH-quinone oxidoreductase subunit L